MKLLKLMLATAMVLDAALIIATTANIASTPLQTIGFSTDTNSNGNVLFSSAR